MALRPRGFSGLVGWGLEKRFANSDRTKNQTRRLFHGFGSSVKAGWYFRLELEVQGTRGNRGRPGQEGLWTVLKLGYSTSKRVDTQGVKAEHMSD